METSIKNWKNTELYPFRAASSPSCAKVALKRTAHDKFAKLNFCLKPVTIEQQTISMIKELRNAGMASVPEENQAGVVKDLDLDRNRYWMMNDYKLMCKVEIFMNY